MTNSKNAQALEDSTRKQWPGVVVYDIGDTAHAKGTSDHNPDDTVLPLGGRAAQTDADSLKEVRATDTMIGPKFTADDAQDLFERLTRRPENQERLMYVIYNRRIRSRNNNPPWSDKPYYGTDPHTNHVHSSTLASEDNNSAPWNLAPPAPPKPPALEVPDMILLQVNGQAPVFTDSGGGVARREVRDALMAKGVPLVVLETQSDLDALLPDTATGEVTLDPTQLAQITQQVITAVVASLKNGAFVFEETEIPT